MQWNQDTFQFLSNLIQEFTLNQNGSYFPRSLNVRSSGPSGSVIVIAKKLILQDLWQLAIQWDESVPQDIHTRWIIFRTQMSDLNQLRIPRCVKFNVHQSIVEVHGFCDASQRAFGTCVYIHAKLGINDHHSKLLCSKSRVAPLKTVSLPRLELSAALLLAGLINKVRELFRALAMPDLSMDGFNDCIKQDNLPLAAVISLCGKQGEWKRLTKIKRWCHAACPPTILPI